MHKDKVSMTFHVCQYGMELLMVPKWLSEQVGNCFILLCLMHTQQGQDLTDYEHRQKWMSLQKIICCHKLYTSFRYWVMELHTTIGVTRSRHVLSELIQFIRTCFPKDKGWGWNIAKMNVFTRMPSYIRNWSKDEFDWEFSLTGYTTMLKKIFCHVWNVYFHVFFLFT